MISRACCDSLQNEPLDRATASLYWHAFLSFSHEFEATFARRYDPFLTAASGHRMILLGPPHLTIPSSVVECMWTLACCPNDSHHSTCPCLYCPRGPGVLLGS